MSISIGELTISAWKKITFARHFLKVTLTSNIIHFEVLLW